jgi:hypothetical protein
MAEIYTDLTACGSLLNNHFIDTSNTTAYVFYPKRQCALSETTVELRGSVMLYSNLLAAPSGLRNWLNWSLTSVLVDV